MENGQQGDLFGNSTVSTPENTSRPLAHMMRPESLEYFQGSKELLAKYPFLRSERIPSLILTGPSGCGKTTLARIIATEGKKEFFTFNAVLGGINDLRKIIAQALQFRAPIIFIDEIHRFNRAQQDALLPQVENGDFILIGATTENPKTSINRALLSRCQIIELSPISDKSLIEIQRRALKHLEFDLENQLSNKDLQKVFQSICLISNHDARKAINAIETLYLEFRENLESITPELIKEKFLGNSRLYDKASDRHYDVISAFIKSMRGSDPDNALLWLAVMIDGGEDPMFIARRLTIFASEDIGNADPRALTLAVSAMEAISKIGMPEARIILGQVTTYLASTVKSNASYRAIDSALEYVRSTNNIEVPTHLRNLHPDKKNYQYPHSYEASFVLQEYGVAQPKQFYQPKSVGQEKFLKDRLFELWNLESGS